MAQLVRTCPECQTPFPVRRPSVDFLCSSACNTKATNREMVRARRLYRALYDWRIRRDPDAWRWICREIARWREEDQAAGRGPPPKADLDGMSTRAYKPQ
jgi:hypothetical protein